MLAQRGTSEVGQRCMSHLRRLPAGLGGTAQVGVHSGFLLHAPVDTKCRGESLGVKLTNHTSCCLGVDRRVDEGGLLTHM